ncbi:Methyl-CpG-binding domain-containing protein 8 [Sesamum angolense]|uniref:Methyl-CpG-binding domain-containing protein 8 n=1 Tax=Sesamum angolense TaxID=2727404 RepID=A0AAE2BXZ0_9LAMI|nr:Methyl-CpG-binding domain-containing protein 8 [Sesamum angolense]
MATAAAATPSAPPPPPPSSHAGRGIRVEDLKQLDISQLSQSELQALSLCSDSAFDVRRTDDVVSPHLDRSLFNESAGSRRQTYSRLHHRSHSRFPGLHPSLKPHRHPHSSSDPVSHSIVHFLKHYLTGNHNPPPPPPLPPVPLEEATKSVAPPAIDLGFPGLQQKLKITRKRARKSKNLNKKMLLENGVGMELQHEELKRRTVGLETEEGVLGFLWGLEGQWCSRRKKRKYVDAGVFGDALPVGWKLLLGLRRRDYRVSVYCRRYDTVSGVLPILEFKSQTLPSLGLNQLSGAQSMCWDHHFCTDINMSYWTTIYFMQGGRVIFEILFWGADQQKDQKTCSIQQTYVLSFEKNAIPADKTDDVAHDVVAHSALGRSSSNVHENDDCLMGIENLPEVQVQDIFECFKCNLTFEEKNLYLQHLFSFHRRLLKGIHVRNSGKSSNELSTPVNVLKNAESPFQEAVPQKEITDHSASVLSLEEAKAVSSDHEANLNSDPVKIKAEDSNAETAEDLNHDGQRGNSSLDMDYGSRCLKPSDGHLEDTPGLTVGEIVFQVGGSSVPLTQSFQFFPPFDSVSNKGEHEFSVVDQKLENVTGFEELRFDDIEPFKYGFVNGQELPSLPGGSMNLGSDSGIADGFNSSVRYSSEEVMLNTLETNQLTVCVWCRSEFKLEGIESETPSDSIGYMCPTCKAKISGHFSGGLSMDPHDF